MTHGHVTEVCSCGAFIDTCRCLGEWNEETQQWEKPMVVIENGCEVCSANITTD